MHNMYFKYFDYFYINNIKILGNGNTISNCLTCNGQLSFINNKCINCPSDPNYPNYYSD